LIGDEIVEIGVGEHLALALLAVADADVAKIPGSDVGAQRFDGAAEATCSVGRREQGIRWARRSEHGVHRRNGRPLRSHGRTGLQIWTGDRNGISIYVVITVHPVRRRRSCLPSERGFDRRHHLVALLAQKTGKEHAAGQRGNALVGYGRDPIRDFRGIEQRPIRAIRNLDHPRRLQRPLDLCPGPPDRQPAGRGAYLDRRGDGGQGSKQLSKKSSGERPEKASGEWA